MFGVDVRAANPIPDKAVAALRKAMLGERMVASMVREKPARPPRNTARWPMRSTMCCWTKKAYRQAGRNDGMSEGCEGPVCVCVCGNSTSE